MTKICTFVLVEIFKIEVALGSVNRYRIKREKPKKKKKKTMKGGEKNEKTGGNLCAYEIFSARNRYSVVHVSL